MMHKEEVGAYLTMPIALIIAGALIGFGMYMGGRTVGGAILSVAQGGGTAQAAQQGAQAQQGGQPTAVTGKIDPVTSADHIRGNPKAKVMLVEYSDPECPFCKQFQSTLKGVMDKYVSGNQVAWVYRNFPIDSLHSKARKEAEATECAAEIGGNDGFWKFYDKLFETTPGNNGLDAAQLPVIAKSVGLDVTKFNACLASGKYASKIQASIDSGVKAGVSGTPTSFIITSKSSKSLVGAVPKDALQNAIDAALKE